MASTYELITSKVLGSNQTAISFSGIPQTYRHLMIRASLKSDYASGVQDRIKVTINGISTTYYSLDIGGNLNLSNADDILRSNLTYLFMLEASGATATSSSVTNIWSNMEILFPNYSQSGSFWKIYYAFGNVESSVAEAYMDFQGGISAANSNAITSINFAPYSGTNFVTGSSVYLYGLSV